MGSEEEEGERRKKTRDFCRRRPFFQTRLSPPSLPFLSNQTTCREQDRSDREPGRDKGSYLRTQKREESRRVSLLALLDRRLPLLRSPPPSSLDLFLDLFLNFKKKKKKKKQNHFDTIDHSDKGVHTHDGFPRLPRLGTLLLSNNRVSRIAPNLENLVPNLSMLVLTNNALRNLADLDALSTLPKLTHLSCLDNVVSKKPMYR